MTDTAAAYPAGAASPLVRVAPLLFGVTVFTSAALVFLVEPMMTKLVLPTLGGSPAVWNTAMAFFQIALLVGYLYAHLLEKLPSLKMQTAIHAVVLLLAALALPLRVTDLLGAPEGRFPIPWLLGVLAISLGAPFAALSATAPLAQAWYARVRVREADAKNPYVLYVASNLGSLIALVAYPVLVEPALRLKVQTLTWSLGYGGFVLLMLLLAAVAVKAGGATPVLKAVAPPGSKVTGRERLTWIALAAIPSSLMLGVTAHITEDIASAPFLWVAPLALYLLTFIIAFSTRPLIPSQWALVFQAAALAGVAWTIGLHPKMLLLMVGVHLLSFFLTALICHQALARRRPDPAHLTEFYLWMSVGGVIGGGFNAFVAPLIFKGVWEYPIVLVLACLVRPWGRGKLAWWEAGLSTIGLGAALIAVGVNQMWGYGVIQTPKDLFLAKMLETGPRLLFSVTPVCAFLLRDRALYYTGLILTVVLGSQNLTVRENLLGQARSFFGVLRITQTSIPGYARNVRLLAHGTTLHGAQALDSADPCRPMTYYAPETPIGQVFLTTGAAKRRMSVGAVGMGSGSVAAYARADDEYRFYEIDPTVVAISGTGQFFTYIKGCAKSPHVDWRIGDARLTLAKEPAGAFDVLLIDAFSSDAVPAHLLTVEAMRMYLSKLEPDGVVIMHLSNRNLDLMRPVAAVAKAAGGYALAQNYTPPDIRFDLVQSAEDVIIVGRDKAALAPYRNDWHWRVPDAQGVAPWTDDYTNLVAAMTRRMKDRYARD
ncbi:MAG: spermidine synthase [Caulobacteraceae bacterium]|nr:spermidine synthase [Caulobacteraceae bacterium]